MTAVQTVALSGQVVEDLTFAPFDAGAFRAQLVTVQRGAFYKPGGLFVFVNVRPGPYRLRLTADRHAPEEFVVQVPPGPTAFDSPPDIEGSNLFERPGDNELIVVADAVAPLTGRVSFAPELLLREIPTGARARAVGFEARLIETVDAGLVSSARLDSVAGLAPGSVLRIIRGRSVRLRFTPYEPLPVAATRLAGRVVLDEDPSVAVSDAEVRLLDVNGSPIAVNDVDGAPVATIATAGATAVLGTEADVATRTNARGDYTLYSARSAPWTSVVLRVRRAGFVDTVRSVAPAPAARTRVDVALTPA